jgi:hypothetical protein
MGERSEQKTGPCPNPDPFRGVAATVMPDDAANQTTQRRASHGFLRE